MRVVVETCGHSHQTRPGQVRRDIVVVVVVVVIVVTIVIALVIVISIVDIISMIVLVIIIPVIFITRTAGRTTMTASRRTTGPLCYCFEDMRSRTAIATAAAAAAAGCTVTAGTVTARTVITAARNSSSFVNFLDDVAVVVVVVGNTFTFPKG